MEATTKPSKIYSLIPKIMRSVGGVTKDRDNTHQKYKFRGIEDMYAAFHPALIEHGVFCVPRVIDSESDTLEGTNADGKAKVSFRVRLRIAHQFFADDGSFVEVITVGEGMDTSDKASNKAMSAAMKYAFIELFSVPTQDVEDSDRDSPEPGTPLDPPPCESCRTPLKLSKEGKGYFCPNFHKPVKPGDLDHTRFPVNKLNDYRTHLKERGML